MANFCIIMTSQNNIKKMLVINSAAAIGIYLAILLGFNRYVIGVFEFLIEDPALAWSEAELATKLLFGKWINYNIFVDLALFCLFYFFIFYKPKK